MRRRKGSILILAMFLLTVVTLLGGLFLTIAVGNIKLQVKDSERQKAFWIAKAGVAELVHNLRGYYNLYEQYNGEQEFGGGKYKIGSATLIGRGYHNTLVVSVGQYPLETTEITSVSKYALIAEVSMNTPTDYVQFGDTKTIQYFSMNQIGGPIHINGDVVIMKNWSSLALMKSKDEYGPVLEASGRIYNSSAIGASSTVIVGEGTIPTPWVYNISNYSKSADISSWPGITPILWPYNATTHGSGLVVTKTGPNGEYKYNLLDDKTTSAKQINVPTTDIISQETFRASIDPDWHITWANPKGTVTKITNEILYSTGLNAIQGGAFGVGNFTGLPQREKISDNVALGMSGADIQIPSDRDMNYIKFVMLKIKGNATHFKGTVGGCDDANKSYAQTDRANKKVSLTFPMYIDKFKFQTPPGLWGAASANLWRGRYLESSPSSDFTGYSLSSSTGLPNQIKTLPAEYIEATGIVNDPVVHPVKVFVGDPATTWTLAPDNDVNSVNITDTGNPFFAVDYAQGKIIFGDGGKCAIPGALGTRIQVIFSHDFDISSGIEAWLSAPVKAVKLDLGTINEQNAPRPPKYKDSIVPIDRQKYGVIFSEVPMVVWGVPKVPVTIVCLGDVYIGPINSTYLNPAKIDDYASTIKVSEPQDSVNLYPVGIISKGMVFYDETLAPTYPDPSPVLNNTWVKMNHGKNFLVNKVCVYHSLTKDPVTMNNGADWYRYRAGVTVTGGTFAEGDGDGGFAQGGSLPTIIGSIYNCADKSVIAQGTAANIFYSIYGSSGIPSLAYANSFRRNPPPHIPKNIYVTNYRILNDPADADTFITELAAYLAQGSSQTYTAQFAETITKLMNSLDGQ